ncbi:SCP2 sterol-binding domain-containing protein [Solwaraspora sp. WMMD1047]|uniref:SCP2 sterol-binding domain-containing protein n=1 Tax=Solwaraspora sp. WMMD1047 TaxID=3016102 RepID=UPI00241637AF|nr:SCP2 sterol-binding domain-containing protein [Solwaraspora sp. WMMD1047]MDG4829024.1 SCP2 sterol-binding domain-containing protein [Solwaraspora sp. WMMD1047]
MSSPTTRFFETLRERGPQMLPAKFALGSVRFDLERGNETYHWFVAMENGTMVVSEEDRPADCVARTEIEVFDRIVTGEAHLIATLIRNDMTVEGILPLLLLFRRAFPSAPSARDPRDLVDRRRHQ